MAPERTFRKIPETARTSSGFAKHERDSLATARKQDGQAERIIQRAIPSRMSILDTVDTRTRTHPELNDLITNEEHRKTLIEFIDARILAANGDRTLINQFIERTNPKSETYDFQFALQVDSLNTHFHIVLDCFPKKRK
jgi:hypothetical protein